MKFIKIKDKWYHLLGMYGGRVYCGKLTDVNNEVSFYGVIWENQPFWYDSELSFMLKTYYYIVRYFKRDCWGSSKFNNLD